jgi:Amt family ammonium transporter
VLLSAVGWLAVLIGNTVVWDVSLPVVLVNGLVAMACGASVALGYMAFATGQADSGMTARGVLGGLAAISAAAPFVSPPAAALVGAVAGLLACFGTHIMGRTLRLHDPLGAVSTHGLGGLWGLVALGLFSEGRSGAGWNAVGLRDYLGVASQGVTGLLPAAGFQADSQQITAQLVGAAVLAACVLLPSFTFLRIGRMVQDRQESTRQPRAEESSQPAAEPVTALTAEVVSEDGARADAEGEGIAR